MVILGSQAMFTKQGIVGASRVFKATLFCGVIAMVVCGLMMLHLGALVRSMGSEYETSSLAEQYGHLAIWMIPAYVLVVSIWDFGMATHKGAPRCQGLTSFVALLFNIGVGYLFIYQGALTHFDSTMVGFKAAPVVTAATMWFKLILTVFYFLCIGASQMNSRDGFFTSMFSGFWEPGFPDILGSYIETSIQKMIGMGIQSGMYFALIMLANYSHLAEQRHNLAPANGIPVELHYYMDPVPNVCSIIIMLSFYSVAHSLFNGVGVACGTRLSMIFSDSAVHQSQCYTTVFSSIVLAIICATPFMCIFHFSPDVVARLFTTHVDDPKVIAKYSETAPWMMWIVLFEAISTTICHGVFPEIRRTHYIVWLRILQLLALCPAGYYWSYKYGHGFMGLMHVWTGTTGGLALVSLLILGRINFLEAATEVQLADKVHKTITLHEEARPILDGKGKGHVLAPDYIQSNRDSPHMMQMRAVGISI